MMRRFLALVLTIMLILSACGEKTKPTEPTGATKNNEVIPDQPIDNGIEPTVPLRERSDLELIEETVISDLCAEGYTGSSAGPDHVTLQALITWLIIRAVLFTALRNGSFI